MTGSRPHTTCEPARKFTKSERRAKPMSLVITSRDVEGIQVVDLNGQLTMGQEDLDFRAELDRLVTAGKLRVALNFNDLHKLDTTGLGTLLFALAKLRKAGGKLAIFALKTTHIDLPIEARLETEFEAFHDEQDAIDSFFPDRDINRFDILEFVQSVNAKRANQ
jgi:anti-sigma B factor antagonist